jgi:NAD(P)-dependent dehydrogenase (short-subunit alcohol dehydrogenase family)
MLLRDRIAVISGAGPGLGRGIALAFAREAADVVLLSRSEATARALATEVEQRGRRALCIQTDITERSACEAALARTLEVFGRVDILVNNAFATGPMEPIIGANVMKAWRAPYKVNVLGTLQLSQVFAESMKPRQSGSVVMINSLAARNVTRDLAAYGASKAALLFATKALAAELGAHGIRVNSIVPGHIDGAALAVYIQMEAQRLGVSEAEARTQIAAQGVLNRIATPEEVANAVVFFASDLSTAITGQELDVNCGQWFH